MYILGIDSSTKKLSIAVSMGSKLLSEVGSSKESKHIVNIIKYIDKALQMAGLTLGDIDIFSVNLGPGDFTGTRIGVSVIKTAAWIKKKPAYGFNALDVFALGIAERYQAKVRGRVLQDRQVIIMPILDVRRNEVYFSFYNIKCASCGKGSDFIIGDSGCSITRIGKYCLIHKDKLVERFHKIYQNNVLRIPGADLEYSNPSVIIGGNAWASYKNIILELLKSGSSFVLDKKITCNSARYVNLLANFYAEKRIKVKNLVPVYVREFIPFGKV